MSNCPTTCSKGSLVDFIRDLLCDCDDGNKKVSDSFLDMAINMAVSKVAGTNKQEFAKAKEVTLENGKCLQSVCGDCEGIIEVVSDGNCDKPKTDISDTDSWLNKMYPSLCSSDNEEYVVQSVEILVDAGCEFKVTPPAPDDGKKHTVTVMCTEIPCLTDGEVPASLCRHWMEIVYLTAGIALMMDDDSESVSKARVWFDLYFKFVELERSSDQDAFIKSIQFGTRVEVD